MDRWYVAETHEGMGRTAKRNLERQAFEVFLPEIRERAPGYVPRRSRALYEKLEPGYRLVQLFPGYIFVRLDLDHTAECISRRGGFCNCREKRRWQAANSTRGVIKLLPHVCLEPLPIRDKTDPITGERRQFVEDFKALIDAGDLDEKAVAEVVTRYVKDASVPITSGPLAGKVGKMVRYHKGALILLMDLLGGKNEVEVPSHQVSLIADHRSSEADPGRERENPRCGNYEPGTRRRGGPKQTFEERVDGWYHPYNAAV